MYEFQGLSKGGKYTGLLTVDPSPSVDDDNDEVSPPSLDLFIRAAVQAPASLRVLNSIRVDMRGGSAMKEPTTTRLQV